MDELEGTLRGHIGLIEEALDRLEGTASKNTRERRSQPEMGFVQSQTDRFLAMKERYDLDIHDLFSANPPQTQFTRSTTKGNSS